MIDDFDIEKWRIERPMDYVLAMNQINQATYKNDVFNTLYKITRLYIPDLLYKYYSLTDDVHLNNQKLETLRSQKVYMSDVNGLNDPFDSRACYYRDDQLKEYTRSSSLGNLIEEFPMYYRITALTANSVNNMPMWAHYSSNHKGFCVSYNMKDSRNVSLAGCTFPVQYTNERIDITAFINSQARKIEAELKRQSAEGKKEILLDDLSMIFLILLFVNVKHETWSYEREFRCTIGSNAKNVPYHTAIPNEIFVGKNCAQSNTDKLVEIAKELQIHANKMTFDENGTDYILSVNRLI